MGDKKTKLTFLAFGIYNETFAVSVLKVPEVMQNQLITEIPNSPKFIKGVINFRGNIIPAIDMRTKFGMPPRDKDDKYVIIVFDLHLGDKKLQVGAIADRVNDVISLEKSDIQDVPDLSNDHNAEFLDGMIQFGERFTMILNVDKIFSIDEISLPDKTKVNKQKK